MDEQAKQVQQRQLAPILMWPVRELFPHPDNPRVVNATSAKFVDLVESIRANGILEPLTVRIRPGVMPELPGAREVLSGHRRLAAAKRVGLKEVPVRDLGEVADDLAFDIVAMGNLHEYLTPLEEGRRVATWLDKYRQDAKAVASKLGKTESWVVQHAQIARGLSPEWQAAGQGLADWQGDRVHGTENQFERWTASHWCIIARLPLSIQASQLAKFKSGRYCSYDRWTVQDLEREMKLEVLYLAKAPFDEGSCSACVDRTDRVLNLYGDVDEVTGDKTRCLNKKCWDRKCIKHVKDEFREVAESKGVPDAVPISLIEPPKDYYGGSGYDEKVRPLKKAFPGLVTADRIEIVKEGAKGAVPAVVVGGKGKNAIKYVRISEKQAAGRGGARQPTATELAKKKAEEEVCRRKIKVTRSVYEQLVKVKQPDDATVLYACLLAGFFPGNWPDDIKPKEIAAWRKVWLEKPKTMCDVGMARLWTGFTRRCRERVKVNYYYPDWWRQVVEVGSLFGISPEAELAKLTPETKTATEGTEKKSKGKKHPVVICFNEKPIETGCMEAVTNYDPDVIRVPTAVVGAVADAVDQGKRASGATRRKKAKAKAEE